ncbi:MAG: acetoin utilization protein AcuC [Chloroflexi bacterium]|nr:acetoin utilization protein AcuC [Chloroflexota bacterium]
MVECAGRFVYRSEYQTYDFGPQHPLRPERLRTSLDLLHALGLGPSAEEHLELPPATLDELQLVHRSAYVDAVQRLDYFADDPLLATEAERWGLGPGDSPAFAGMHAVSALIAGGTLNALRGVLGGEYLHGFNPAGGLHHALADRASGFCVYNDAAIAIAAALREREARVLYLDFDAHHGDGVQAAFYDEPRVLTFSIHETGRHLFPGTGFSEELGAGMGRGYSLNVPVEPFTEDASWLECLELLVPAVAEWFAPDVIVSQHGCDSHSWDPITDLRLSTRAFAVQAHMVHELAHRVAGGRWIALGGGGYDWVRVVPRSWALVWSEMNGTLLPTNIPADWSARWAETARNNGFWPMPASVLDDTDAWHVTPRHTEIQRINRARAEALRRLVLPGLVRHAYPAYRIEAAPPKLPEVIIDAGGTPPESRVAHVEIPGEQLLLRDLCPPSLIEQLRPDPGLVAFTRRPEREHAILQRVANSGHGSVAVAHTAAGVIVAQIVLTPAEDWWRDVPGAYELSIETSSNWRRMGIAHHLVEFCFQPGLEWMEHLIVLAMGLDWHWDLAGTGLDAAGYRAVLRSLFEPVGFRSVHTSEPNVAMHASNILLVRVGSMVSEVRRAALDEALYIAPSQRHST